MSRIFVGTVCGALAVAAVVCGAPAWAQSAGVFEKVAGTWVGGGTATVSTGSQEPVRCRATFSPEGENQLSLSIRCASDSFNLQATGEIVREGNRISGSFSEENSGTSGSVSGSVTGDGISAVVSGAGLSARLGLRVRGRTQSVTLVSDGAVSARAEVTLRRE